MYSAGAYVELCIDGLIEQRQRAEEEAHQERDARAEAEQQLGRKVPRNRKTQW